MVLFHLLHVCMGLCHKVAPYRSWLSWFAFILERKKKHGNPSHTFSPISPLADDKIILTNSNWFRGCLIWQYEVCCEIIQTPRRPCKSSWGFYVNPCKNKFVGPHPRASGDGYGIPGDRRAAIQQQAAYLERLVLSAPLLEDKSFKDTHYLTIVVPSPL